MDEVLIKNFMIFQDAVEEGGYDLVIADEAWDIDHYWHEHPELKKAKLAWFTDFVGYVPMPAGGEHEAFLTTDYNAEMIEHVERHPGRARPRDLRRHPEDIVPLSFGKDLPAMRDWVPKHFDFAGYIIGEHPANLRQPRESLRAKPWLPRRRAGVHRHRRRLGRRHAPDQAHPAGLSDRARQAARAAHDRGRRPAHRSGVPRSRPPASKCGPSCRISTGISPPAISRWCRAASRPAWSLRRRERPSSIFRCRTISSRTSMSPTASRYGAGIRMDFAASTPEMIADAVALALSRPNNPKPVEADGPSRAAAMIAELL